jgi:carboxylesterase type B
MLQPTATQDDKFPPWDRLAVEAGCKGTSSAILACLKKVPAQTLKSILEVNNLSFRPTTDNYTLVTTPELKRRNGQLHSFPIMVGSNAEEGRVFQINKNNLTKYLEDTFPNNLRLQQSVREAYPRAQNGYETDYDIQSQIMTDLQFGCPASLLAYDSVKGGYPTWRFYYSASFPNLQKFQNAGAYHASEIELIFGTYGSLPTTVSARPSPQEEINLSNTMQAAWAAFAKNPTRGPGWVEYGKAQDDLAEFGGPAAPGGIALITPNLVDSRCSLFAALY